MEETEGGAVPSIGIVRFGQLANSTDSVTKICHNGEVFMIMNLRSVHINSLFVMACAPFFLS